MNIQNFRHLTAMAITFFLTGAPNMAAAQEASSALGEGEVMPRAATPKSSPGQWIETTDYPSAELADGTSGRTVVTLGVSSGGSTTGCTVDKSSGSAVLDDLTCELLLERAHFYPASDQSGNAVPGSYQTAVVWAANEKDYPTLAHFEMIADIGSDGRPVNCTVLHDHNPGPGFEMMAQQCFGGEALMTPEQAAATPPEQRRIRVSFKVSLEEPTE